MEDIDETNKLQNLQSSRALSQPTNFSWNSLPPLSSHSNPLPNPNSNFSIDEINHNSQNYMRISSFKASEGLPPRKNHRRSSSDVPLGFSAMIQSSPQLIPISGQTFSGNSGVNKEVKSEEISSEVRKLINSDNVDGLHSSGIEDKDSECSDNEVESRVNRKKGNEIAKAMKINSLIEKTELGGKRSNFRGEIGPITRHFRSVSMDSFMGDLDCKLGPLGTRIGQQSPIHSLDANSLKFSLEFGNGEFTGAELKKIMANDKLAEIALSDPKRAKRILANRQSAARSKERKMRYISELELKVQRLQTEATTLSTQLALMQRETSGLSSQNNELKFRLQAMEQQAQLKDALNEALTAEVQRLKLATVENRPSTAWLGNIG